MNYDKGSIFNKKNIQFKETEKLDLRVNGHPMLIPIDIDFMDNYYYFFSISSQVQYYGKDSDRYFPISKGNGTGLSKASLVDLKHVYKQEKQSHDVRGFLTESQISALVKKFCEYANRNNDIDCTELLGLID